MRMMASRPSRGRLPCAARPRVSISIHAKPLWPIADLQVGGFGDDRGVGRPFLDERVGADARVLLVDDRRHDQPPALEAAFRRHARRVDHRGHAALHVLRSAAVQAPVANRRAQTARPCPRRRPCPCGRRTSAIVPGHWPSSTPITFGRPGATSWTCTSSPMLSQVRGDRRRDLRFARGAGNERRVHRIDRHELAEKIDGRDRVTVAESSNRVDMLSRIQKSSD